MRRRPGRGGSDAGGHSSRGWRGGGVGVHGRRGARGNPLLDVGVHGRRGAGGNPLLLLLPPPLRFPPLHPRREEVVVVGPSGGGGRGEGEAREEPTAHRAVVGRLAVLGRTRVIVRLLLRRPPLLLHRQGMERWWGGGGFFVIGGDGERGRRRRNGGGGVTASTGGIGIDFAVFGGHGRVHHTVGYEEKRKRYIEKGAHLVFFVVCPLFLKKHKRNKKHQNWPPRARPHDDRRWRWQREKEFGYLD